MLVVNAQSTTLDRPSQIGNAIEAGWLLGAVLVPIAIAHEDFVLGYIQMPKVYVLRTAALYLVAVFAMEWAIEQRLGREPGKHGDAHGHADRQ